MRQLHEGYRCGTEDGVTDDYKNVLPGTEGFAAFPPVQRVRDRLCLTCKKFRFEENMMRDSDECWWCYLKRTGGEP